MKQSFKTHGICASQIDIELEDGVIKEVAFTGGCNGNCKGLSLLVTGMKAKDVIDKISGVDCKGRGTSCPDQLADSLRKMI